MCSGYYYILNGSKTTSIISENNFALFSSLCSIPKQMHYTDLVSMNLSTFKIFCEEQSRFPEQLKLMSYERF